MWFDDVRVCLAVIGSGVAAVMVAAGPAQFRAVFQLSAAFFSVISGVAGLFSVAGAVQHHVVDHMEVLTVTVDVKLLS